MKLEKPTSNQIKASNPNISVWINASAGSGKTKTLINRFLRLMLNGSKPYNILCITFTKAGAQEIKDRILNTLNHWTTLNDSELSEQIENISGKAPTKLELSEAGNMFYEFNNNIDNMKIYTFHAFCQSIIAQFPHEAGVLPDFKVTASTQAINKIIKSIKKSILTEERYLQDKPLTNDINQLVSTIGYGNALEIIKEALSSQKYKRLAYSSPSVGDRIRDIITSLDNKDYITEANYNEKISNCNLAIIQDNFPKEDQHLRILKDHIDSVAGTAKGPSAQEAERAISTLNGPMSINSYREICKIIYTNKGTLRVNFKKACADSGLAEKFEAIDRHMDIAQVTKQNIHTTLIHHRIFNKYSEYKHKKGYIDYDDMISKVLDLLKDSSGLYQWVLYKMDQQIHHIMVDESQDTNPLQWQIIKEILSNFFDDPEESKTILVVGDIKQNLYSFNDADAKSSLDMLQYIKETTEFYGVPFEVIDLQETFRSNSGVIDFVNYMCNDLFANSGISNTKHISMNSSNDGEVLIVNSKHPEREEAKQYVESFVNWITNKILYLKSQGKNYGDMAIIVRTHDNTINHINLIPEIIKKMIHLRIPYSYMGKENSTSHLKADMLALAKFCTQPLDDFSLAQVLRSPLFNISHQDLFTISQGHDGSKSTSNLYYKLGSSNLKHIAKDLKSLIKLSKEMKPYMFFYNVIYTRGNIGNLLHNSSYANITDINNFLNFIGSIDFNINLEFCIKEIEGNLALESTQKADSSNDSVQISTIHGFKGMEASCVFFPLNVKKDVIRANSFITANGKTQSPLLYKYRKHGYQDNEYILKHQTEHLESATEDEKKALYVAITRAKSHLYILPFNKLESHNLSNTYTHMKGFGNSVSINDLHKDIEYKEIAKPTERPVSKNLIKANLQHSVIALEFNTQAPLTSDEIKLGDKTHKILSALLHIKSSSLQKTYIENALKALPNQEHRDFIEMQINNVMNHDIIREILECNKSTIYTEMEVYNPLSTNHKRQTIDLVIIKENEIIIIDYKTQKNSDISQEIKEQLQRYQESLEILYPNKTVSSFVFLTQYKDMKKISS